MKKRIIIVLLISFYAVQSRAQRACDLSAPLLVELVTANPDRAEEILLPCSSEIPPPVKGVGTTIYVNDEYAYNLHDGSLNLSTPHKNAYLRDIAKLKAYGFKFVTSEEGELGLIKVYKKENYVVMTYKEKEYKIVVSNSRELLDRL